MPSPDGSLTIAMVAACPFPAPRGTPIRILRLAEGLASRGHRVHVVTYHFGMVASCSERIRDRLVEIQAVPADRVTVVPNGVETGLFDGAVPLWSAAPHPPTLVFTGNLARYQGIDFMLAAFRKVLNHRADVRLTMVTTAPFGAYEARARELGVRQAIDLVEAPLERVPSLLAGADVALNPRLTSEWLANDGDVDGFAEGVITLLGDHPMAETMGQNAQHFVRANHSWDHAVDRTEAMYAGLLA